jgi:predicted amidohydrolase
MKVSFLQIPLVWENPAKNRSVIQQWIQSSKNLGDLLVLPEMFTSGFTMHPEKVAETMQGETIQWIQELANTYEIAITGSLVILEDTCFYNRMVFVHPNGKMDYYNKRHLFKMAGEHEAYTSGKKSVIVNYKDWKICLQVCYDLRFPVFSRNTQDYDLLIYVANWPNTRIQAWEVLLRARAIENQCYVIGVNRIGEDANQLNYPGQSAIIDAFGNVLIEAFAQEGIFQTTLSLSSLQNTRKKLPFLQDRDTFSIQS